MNKHVSRFLIGCLVVLGALSLVLGIKLMAEYSPEGFLLLLFSPLIYCTGALVEEMYSNRVIRKEDNGKV